MTLSLNVTDGPTTEYEKAKIAVVKEKAHREDDIAPDVLKMCNLGEDILNLCKRVLLKKQTPGQWSVLNIIPILKFCDK